MQQEDSELHLTQWIQRARDGERSALDHVCRHYEPVVRAMIGRSMGPRARRWDHSASIANLVLDEVVRGLQRAPTQHSIGSVELRQRLRRTANLRVIDHVRAHRFDSGESACLRPLGDVHASESTTGTVARRDYEQRLARSIAAMPPIYFDVLHLHHQRHLSQAEIAIRLGIQQDTVRKRLARGYRLLHHKVTGSSSVDTAHITRAKNRS